MDEVLRRQTKEIGGAGGAFRTESMEVYLYHDAMRQVQSAIEDGTPISDWLIRSAHKILLGYGRGANQSPGQHKDEQNYLVDRAQRQILFIPISPEHLPVGMEKLFSFMENEKYEALIRTAMTHIEFEALHPFKDGIGRIGRMLITLMLWKLGKISAPHIYISGYL